MIDYPTKLSWEIIDLFKDKDIAIGRIGNKERWYKSPVCDEEYDGDSLYAKMKKGDYQLVDGKDISDVGVFNVYNDTFRRVKLGEKQDPGFMVAYAKLRELKKPNNKHFWLNLLIGNIEKDELKKEQLNYQLLSDYITQPVFPEVSVNDQDKKLHVSQRLVYPLAMNFEKDPRQDLFNWDVDLSKYGISLEEIVKKGLDSNRVRSYIKSIGPSLGYDHTYEPVFPKTRNDVCAVRHMAENGVSYGYDTIYLVWQDKSGEMRTMDIKDSRYTKDYLHIGGVVEEGENIVVDFGTGGSFGGKSWDDRYKISKKDLDLE